MSTFLERRMEQLRREHSSDNPMQGSSVVELGNRFSREEQRAAAVRIESLVMEGGHTDPNHDMHIEYIQTAIDRDTEIYLRLIGELPDDYKGEMELRGANISSLGKQEPKLTLATGSWRYALATRGLSQEQPITIVDQVRFQAYRILRELTLVEDGEAEHIQWCFDTSDAYLDLLIRRAEAGLFRNDLLQYHEVPEPAKKPRLRLL